MRGSPFRFFWVVLLLSLPFWILGFAMTGTSMLFGLPVSALMFVCPSVAAWLSLRGKTGEFLALVKRVFSPKVRSIPGLLLAAGAMPAIMTAVWLLDRFGGAAVPLPQITPGRLGLAFAVYFVGAVGEEIGWMGVAFEPLRARLGSWSAAGVMGIAWGLWHLVPYLVQGRSIGWIAAQCAATVAFRVVMVWIYDLAGRSVLSAIVFHTFINVGYTAYPIEGSFYNPATVALITCTLALVLVLSDVPLLGTGHQDF